ncbi:helix-turn-helix transcriptional regulator [Paenibacillus jamilae]|uniref:helix-turn-helix domain-containing protein n=1 Tax=Paenibacillus jamilae TaxID=114136 RepID=UPI003D2DE844
MEVFSARLKWLRESKGFSQQEMADKLGLSQSYYGRFERDKGEPNLETLAKIPAILEQSIDFLLGITDFTYNATIIRDKFDRASSSLFFLRQDLQFLQFDPHSGLITSKDFDPNNPESVKLKIDSLRQAIPLWEKQQESARKTLLGILNEIPLVKESTISEIKENDPYGFLLADDLE